MIWLDNALAIGIRLLPNNDKLSEFRYQAETVISKLYKDFDNIQVARHETDLGDTM